jgi:hypothetical protein
MLKEEIRQLTGKKRRFYLMRVAEVEPDVARKMCGIAVGTYNAWLQNRDFVTLYRRVDEFIVEYKQEAIQLLRRDNQLAAVMLEEQIISKMREEVATGEYNLLRTNLARDVYTKLIGDLDVVPIKEASGITFIDKMAVLMGRENARIAPPEPNLVLEQPQTEVNTVPQEG